MEKEIVYTDKTGKELNTFWDDSFPLWVGFKSLSGYYGNYLEIHWHQALEFTLVTEGEMEYQANDTTLVIEKGNGIFVNTNTLHAARQIGGSDCSYTAIRFSPALIGGLEGNRMYEQYINPILCCKGLPFLYLSSTIEWQKEILESLRELSEMYSESSTCCEFTIMIQLLKIWKLMYTHCDHLLKQNYSTSLITEKLYAALAYIHKSYTSKLTLDDIAGACHYSKSECCRMFNKILHQSPMDYVITYRIHQSLPLIASGKYPMTEIAGKVGISGSSYFSEVFHKIIGCTPTEYKKRLDIQKL